MSTTTKAPKLLAPVIGKATSVAHRARTSRVHKLAPHAEHLGFVAYAGVEVLHIPGGGLVVAFWLLVTGVWVMVTRPPSDNP